ISDMNEEDKEDSKKKSKIIRAKTENLLRYQKHASNGADSNGKTALGGYRIKNDPEINSFARRTKLNPSALAKALSSPNSNALDLLNGKEEEKAYLISHSKSKETAKVLTNLHEKFGGFAGMKNLVKKLERSNAFTERERKI